MLVTDRRIAGGEDALVAKAADAAAGGVNVVQLREKDLAYDDVTRLAARLQEAIAGRALLIVNRPAMSALHAGGDGVHLPEDAEWLGRRPGLLLGRSVHSVAAARRAESDGADYVVFGPVYETDSHAGTLGLGADALREVVANVSVPVIAIGGVTKERVQEVMAAGAGGVAVVRAILAQEDGRAAAQALRSAIVAGSRV